MTLTVLRRLTAVPVLSALVLSGSSASGTAHVGKNCPIRSVSFEVSGSPSPLVVARRGDRVAVSFEVPPDCVNRMVFASFVAPDPAFDGSRLDQQAEHGRDSRVFGPGRHSMAVDVFDFRDSDIADCAATPRPNAIVSTTSDESATVVFEPVGDGHGANQGGPYDSTCDGSPSGNGNGGGKPCAGCVGNADDKNPPGQEPGGGDNNAGYECDRNHGVGQGNPAHSGCENFQIDLAYGPIAGDTSRARPGTRLIAAIFCVRKAFVCYTTDRTDTRAVIADLGS